MVRMNLMGKKQKDDLRVPKAALVAASKPRPKNQEQQPQEERKEEK